MKLTIQPTEKIVELDGVNARVWQGTTESGIPATVFITRISPDTDKEEDHTQFREELQETVPPTARVEALPFRLIL